VTRRPRPTGAASRDAPVVAGLALGGLALLVLTPAVAVTTLDRVLAWLALVALTAAALWIPVRRYRTWPAADQRAARRALGATLPVALGLAAVLLVVGAAAAVVAIGPERGFAAQVWSVPVSSWGWPYLVILAAPLLFALRPASPRAVATWMARKQLEAPPPSWVGRELRRLRAWRTLPAVAGAALGAGPSLAYARWLDVHGPGRAVEGMPLSEASMVWPFDPLTLALVGYLLGVVVAEATRRRPAPGGTAAHLAARTPARYLTRPARAIPPLLGGLTLIAASLARLGGEPVWWPAAVAVVLVVAVLAAQRWVVRRPQRLDARGEVRIDDALRSSAAHALTGASGALLLVTTAGALDAAVRAWDLTGPAVVGSGVAILAVIGVWVLWLGYGSSHAVPAPHDEGEPAVSSAGTAP
jgi:hypothetical protein